MGNRRAEKQKRTTVLTSKYEEAITLYATTDMSSKQIAEQCQVSLSAFRIYLRRHYRDLVLKRNGLSLDGIEPESVKLREKRGQTKAAHKKYKDAILACDDVNYIQYNVSQIAHLFHLDGTALGNQLKLHYPEIIERREKLRKRMGIQDNISRGVRQDCKEIYAQAIELFRTTPKNLLQVAEECNVSVGGLSQHLRFYHKDIWRQKIGEREQAIGHRRKGEMNGCSRICEPKLETKEKYKEALELYRNTYLTVSEILDRTGVSPGGFRNYLRRWNRDLMLERRGGTPAQHEDGCGTDLSQQKRFLKSTAGKYAAAIEDLKVNLRPVTQVAAQFGIDPDIFRCYLYTHEPEITAKLGRKKAVNGRTVSCQSEAKYAEAVHLFETTTESLKSIAQRLGLVYNSLGGYVRRSTPESILKHKALLKAKDMK
ncbi:MAG: sigma-70 region 4 domain-containing protein [Parabacteroides sp.]|nr:sigma-70 region 4 domain-containing protein [Parabacteroides sp.]